MKRNRTEEKILKLKRGGKTCLWISRTLDVPEDYVYEICCKKFKPEKCRCWIFIFSILVALILMEFVSASVSLSDQGTDVKSVSTGQVLASGNITIEIYSVPTGGSAIYSNTFVNNVTNGSWNVVLQNLNLEYNRIYYKDYSINGDDLDFDGSERLAFNSPLGLINNASNFNFSLIQACSSGQAIRQVNENGSVICASISSSGGGLSAGGNYLYNDSTSIYLNETKLNTSIDARASSFNVNSSIYSNSTTWWASLSGFVSGWFVKNGNDLEFNETKLNATIDARAVVTNLTNYALKNQSETFAGNITVAGNITSNYGFFGWIGSLASRITKLWVTDINATGNIETSGNVSASYVKGDGSLLTNLPAGTLGTSINTTEIDDGTITSADISANAINTSHILDGNVTDAKISGMNWTKLNSVPSGFADNVDNDTLYYADGVYLYNNGSNWFYFNETKLNQTIDARAVVTNLTNYALKNQSENFTGNINVIGDLNIVNSSASSKFYVNGTSGNVGIGTTDPAALLVLSKGSTGGSSALYPTLKVINTNTDITGSNYSIAESQWINLNGIGSKVQMTAGVISSATDNFGYLGTLSSHRLGFQTAATERMTIDANGNVGIGTTNPTSEGKLYVNGSGTLRVIADSSGQYSIFNVYSNGVERGAFYQDSIENLTKVEAGVTNSLNFVVPGASDAMLIQYATGRVGIGTTTPGASLTVKGVNDGTGGILLRNNAGSNYGAIYGDGGNLSIQANRYSGDKMFLGTIDNTQTLTLSNGNVGIGTTNPNNKLTVAGDINATGSIYKNGGTPLDYVFDNYFGDKSTSPSSYSGLMSLNELQSYVETNRHLPNVESSKYTGNVEVSTLPNLLLEKTEENTLYILELKAENDNLKAENTAIKQTLCEMGRNEWC